MVLSKQMHSASTQPVLLEPTLFYWWWSSTDLQKRTHRLCATSKCSQKLWQAVLFLDQHLILAKHPGTIKMNDDTKRRFYWSNMETDGFKHVERCATCRRRRSSNKHQRSLQLVSPSKKLECLAIDIHYFLTKTTQGKWFIIVVTDRYSKLNKIVSDSKVAVPLVPAVRQVNLMPQFANYSCTLIQKTDLCSEKKNFLIN